jgi:hypothetical protein
MVRNAQENCLNARCRRRISPPREIPSEREFIRDYFYFWSARCVPVKRARHARNRSTMPMMIRMRIIVKRRDRNRAGQSDIASTTSLDFARAQSFPCTRDARVAIGRRICVSVASGKAHSGSIRVASRLPLPVANRLRAMSCSGGLSVGIVSTQDALATNNRPEAANPPAQEFLQPRFAHACPRRRPATVCVERADALSSPLASRLAERTP